MFLSGGFFKCVIYVFLMIYGRGLFVLNVVGDSGGF